MENWKPTSVAPSYEVSDEGRVRNARRWVMRPHLRNKYLCVGLRVEGKQKKFAVHRLVALAFIPNPDPTTKTEVDHKDRVKLNNHADNLRWVTRLENLANQSNLSVELVERVVQLHAAGFSPEEIVKALS